MSLLTQAENSLADLFKGAPKLSKSTKESLANIWPWLALVGGLIQLWAAKTLWDLLRAVDAVDEVFGGLFSTLNVYSTTDKMFMYIGIALTVITAVLMLAAFPKLQKRQKGGWDLIFLAGLLNVVYGVLNIFITGRGFGHFIFSLLASAVGFWLLFAVRDMYSGAGLKTSGAASTKDKAE